MQKKNMAIIYLCSCDDYAFTVATSIMSIEKTNPGLVDNYIIFCDETGLTQETRDILRKVSDNIIFRDFTKEYIDTIIKTNEAISEHWTYLLYAKVYCIDYVKYYKNVLFLGGDMIVVADISDLLETGPLAWRRCVRTLNECTDIDSPDIYTNPNGCFIFMTDALEKYSSHDLITILNTIVFQGAGPDEFCYGMFAFLHNIPTTLLRTYNRMLESKNLEEAKIIHGAPYKFWKYNCVDFLLPEFNHYYQQWLDLGGKGYEGPHEGPACFPKERYKVIPYLRTMEFFARFNDIIYQKLPNVIRPSLAIYKRTLPLFIIGKNNKECNYYIFFKFPLTVHIGFTCKHKTTDTVRQLFDILHTVIQDFSIKDTEKGQLFIYREYIGKLQKHTFSKASLQEIAQEFLSFLEKTLPFILDSPLWREEAATTSALLENTKAAAPTAQNRSLMGQNTTLLDILKRLFGYAFKDRTR